MRLVSILILRSRARSACLNLVLVKCEELSLIFPTNEKDMANRCSILIQMDFFNKVKYQGVFKIDAKDFKEFVKAFEQSECNIVSYPGKSPQLELKNLINESKRPLTYQFANIRQSYMEQLIVRQNEGSIEPIGKVKDVGHLMKINQHSLSKKKQIEQIIDFESSDSYFSDQQQSKEQRVPKATYTENQQQRAILRMKVLQVMRERQNLTSNQLKQILLTEFSINQPQNSLKKLMQQFCEGYTHKRGGFIYKIKQEFKSSQAKRR